MIDQDQEDEPLKPVQDMTVAELVAEIGWNPRILSDITRSNERRMRRIINDEEPCPAVLRAWLEKLAKFNIDNPLPDGWRN